MIATWQKRLDALDTSKGVSNAMRENCMRAEILELRAALREPEAVMAKAISAALAAQRREYSAEMSRLKRNAINNKQQSKFWRAAASKYKKLATQKEPANERKRIEPTPVQREPRQVRTELRRDIQTQWAGGKSPFAA